MNTTNLVSAEVRLNLKFRTDNGETFEESVRYDLGDGFHLALGGPGEEDMIKYTFSQPIDQIQLSQILEILGRSM